MFSTAFGFLVSDMRTTLTIRLHARAQDSILATMINVCSDLAVNQLSPHLCFPTKRRYHIDNPHMTPVLPLHRRQPGIPRIDPLRHDLIDQRPQRDADRLLALVEQPELLEQDRRHDQPFEIAERD